MTTQTQCESTTLYYRAGSSDKIYTARIEPSGDGFVVNFAFGRRGSTLQTGTKTAGPVDYETAKKIFDKLVASKTASGYTPGEDGTPYQQTDNQDRATGILPQLLNPIDEEEARKLLSDPAWLAQEKLDGRRVLIRRSGDEVIGINRKGLVISLPEPIVARAMGIGSQQWIMDGECIGDTFVAFDLLESACQNLRARPYKDRLKTLYGMMPAGTGPIRSVETAIGPARKKAMMARLKEDKKEGIVFKRIEAPYAPGRPASGGDQLKLKFTATASCIVAGVNGAKRSVSLELLDGDGKRVNVGNVTIPANQAIPPAGAVAEIKYLYCHVGGSLYQPVYLGVRDDIEAAACVVGQLKYKAGESEDGSDDDGG